MDTDAIDKIVDRKKLRENIDRIQEKVSRENKEIIKLQVAQETAFREQKEKLADVEGERERLQQNILQLQMQYEELSSKYQEELRRRPEILNKVNYTRKLCDELEKLAQGCMEQSARAKADREHLVKIYGDADKKVCDLLQRHEAMVQQAKTRINGLLEELKGMKEQQAQLTEKYNESQLQRQALLSQLEVARCDRNELAAATEDAKKKLEAANIELIKRDDANINLQREIHNMAADTHRQLAEARDILTKKDNELKSAADEIDSLKKALSNQEQFATMQCDRNKQLLEKLSLAEEQHQLAEASNQASNKKLEDMTSMYENVKNHMEKLKDETEALTKDLISKQQILNSYDEELESYKQRLLEYDFKVDKVTLQLNKTSQECENKNKLIEKMEADNGRLIQTLSESEKAFKTYRDEAEEKLKSQAETIKEKCCEIEIHTSNIIQANVELQSEKEARAKVEADLVKLKRDFEIEVETLREHLTKKVSQLEAGMRAKEEERSREMKDSFLKRRAEMEKEKSALQEVINGLEKRIVNIVTSETHAAPPRSQQEPEQDVIAEWALSTGYEAGSEQGGQGEDNADTEDVNLIPVSLNLFEDSLFNFTESTRDSERLRPQRATEKRYFAFASEMRSPSQRPPTPPPQRARDARDARHTAIPVSLNSFEDSLFSFTESTRDSERLRPQRATEKRYFAFASEMRSPSQRPPTPPPQRARDARDARDARHTADACAAGSRTKERREKPKKKN